MRPRREVGITLIELLVSMTILVVISTLIIMGWVSLQNSYSSTVKGAEARSEARDALARMTREIRDMQSPAEGTHAIISANVNEIRFYSSFNDATARDDPGTEGSNRVYRVRYWYAYDAAQQPVRWCIYRQRDSDNSGTFTASDPTMVVARNIVNGETLPGQTGPIPLFQYFGVGSATALASPVVNVAEVATVRMRVIADLNPAHTPNYFDLVTTVQPRNLVH